MTWVQLRYHYDWSRRTTNREEGTTTAIRLHYDVPRGFWTGSEFGYCWRLASILLDRARSTSHRSHRPRQRYGGTTMLLRRCYVCIRICLCYDAPRCFWTCPKTSWSFQVSSRSIKAHHELLRSTTNFVPTPLRFLEIPKSWSTVWKFVYVGKGLY